MEQIALGIYFIVSHNFLGRYLLNAKYFLKKEELILTVTLMIRRI